VAVHRLGAGRVLHRPVHLTRDGAGTQLAVDQDGVPDDLHEHVRTNWTGFYFDPLIKHFAMQA